MHVKLVSDEQDDAAEWVIVIGILGMIVSILGNIEAAEEMYPLYLQKVYEQLDAQLRRNKVLLLVRWTVARFWNARRDAPAWPRYESFEGWCPSAPHLQGEADGDSRPPEVKGR